LPLEKSMEEGAWMIVFFLVILVAAVSCSPYIFRKRRGDAPIDRAIAAAMPALLSLLGIAVFLNILDAPYFEWNNTRLARTFAVFNGISLYPGEHATGPIMGTLHTPISHILFWPAIFAPTPAAAICIGSMIAFLLVFGPIAWLHWPRKSDKSRNILYASYSFVTCGYILFWYGPLGGGVYSTFRIHTDAAAICFAALAGGILFRAKSSLGWRPLLLSSICAALSVGCKQTMAPVLVALCLFLLIASGLRTALLYLALVLGSGSLVCLLIVRLFGPMQNIVFNTIILAWRRPPSGQLRQAMTMGLSDAALESLPVVFCLLLFVLYWYFHERNSTNGWRKLLATQRWLVFIFIGLALAPVCIKARMTVGGDANHIGLFCFFLTLGTTLGLSQFMAEDAPAAKATASKLLSIVLVAVSLPGVIVGGAYALYLRAYRAPAVSVAAGYAIKHPGRAYFPRYPLADIYAEHRFYTSDGALEDREIAGHGVTPAQYATGIPSHADVIALSKGNQASAALRDYISGWPRVNDPELPDWIVYRRPSAVVRAPQ
jgi:hypothetical protein